MAFKETGFNNTQALLNLTSPYGGDWEAFLNAEDLLLAIHPCKVEDPGALRFSYDIDGAVCEIGDIRAIKLPVHFLLLPEQTVEGPRKVWPFLKKHLRPQQHLKAWSHTHGLLLAYVDGGWHLHLSLVPEAGQACNLLQSDSAAKHLTAQTQRCLSQAFSSALHSIPSKLMNRPSLLKNNLRDVSRFNIVGEDQAYILRILDQAISSTSPPAGLRYMITLTRFGQKDPRPLVMTQLFHYVDTVKAMSVHVACSVTHKDNNIDLLWSRYGLHRVIGGTGSVYTALSLHEAANFQSPLDHHQLELDGQVLDIFPLGPGEQLNFVQFYADTPHRHQNPFFKHPVSGAIVTSGLFDAKVTRALASRALKYLMHFEDLVEKGEAQIAARLEAVIRLDHGHIPPTLQASNRVSGASLWSLLLRRPMFVPFLANADEGVRTVCKGVGMFLTGAFRAFLDQHRNQGGFEPTWRAYQLELSLEEHFHGQPRVSGDQNYSSSLGCNSVRVNSRMRERGFLALAPFNSACVDGQDPPPLRNWVSNFHTENRIMRIWTLADTFRANVPVIGEAQVKMLIGDLNSQLPPPKQIALNVLQATVLPAERSKLKDTLAYHTLAKQVLDHLHHWSSPLTLRHAVEMVRANGGDPQACLAAGLNSLRLNWFPIVNYWTRARSRGARW